MSNSILTPGANQEWAQASDKANEAASCAGEMASHAASAVGAMASQAAGDAGRKADSLTASAGAGIHEWGDKLSKNAPHDGMLGRASQAVARGVQHSGEYLEDAKLSGMADDVTQLVRRYPVPAIFIAIGLGWCVARILKH